MSRSEDDGKEMGGNKVEGEERKTEMIRTERMI